MGRQRHILHAGERMIGLERLGMIDVESGVADLAALERIEHRAFIHQRAARRH